MKIVKFEDISSPFSPWSCEELERFNEILDKVKIGRCKLKSLVCSHIRSHFCNREDKHIGFRYILTTTKRSGKEIGKDEFQKALEELKKLCDENNLTISLVEIINSDNEFIGYYLSLHLYNWICEDWQFRR